MPAFAPARLQPVKEIPVGQGWLYEPKFDGYRGMLVNSPSGRGSVWSRNDKDLGRYFPELVALAGALPRSTVLDGEIVMPTSTGVSFLALQQRLASLGRESAVAFIAFDVLRCQDDLRPQKLSQRRRRLEQLVTDADQSQLQLMTQTDDLDVAAAWLDESLSISGIEGLVAKLDEPYPQPESRRWRKVRRLSTMEFRVVGFVPEARGSVRLVLANSEGEAAVVGTTYPVRGAELKPLEALLADALPAEHRIRAPFDDGRAEWLRLPPGSSLLAEVAITTLDSGVLRQPARFVRWRLAAPPDLA
jgi:ATP-dependent DNA ligase